MFIEMLTSSTKLEVLPGFTGPIESFTPPMAEAAELLMLLNEQLWTTNDSTLAAR